MKNNPNRLIQRFLRKFFAGVYRDKGAIPEKRAPQIIRIPRKYTDVAKSLVDKEWLQTATYKRHMGDVDWAKTHPDIKAFAIRFIKECETRGIPMQVFELYRSHERQENLKAQGRSNAGAGKSPHQYGCAVDIISSRHGWNYTDRQWELIGVIGREVARKMNLKIVWGGDWDGDGDIYDNRLFDAAHWELKDWRDYRAELYMQRPRYVAVPKFSPEWFANAQAYLKAERKGVDIDA